MPSFSKPEVVRDYSVPRWSAPASFSSGGIFRRFYLATVMLAVLVVMMLPGGGDAAPVGCIPEGSFQEGMDYFQDKSVTSDASHFAIDYFGHYKVVTNKYVDETYVLTYCGAPVPDKSKFTENAKYFTVPLKSVAMAETVGASVLELIGMRTAVSYIDTTWLTSVCFNKMANEGMVEDLGGAWKATGTVYPTDKVEKVDAIIVGNTAYADPKHIAFSSTTDNKQLARAEWLKFMGAFFNVEGVANSVYQESASRYACHSKAAQEQPTKPIVVWLDYASWNAEPYTLQNTPYKMELTKSAGGMVGNTEKKSFATTAELLAELKVLKVDIVIDESYNMATWADVKAAYEGLGDEWLSKWYRNDRMAKTVPGEGVASDWFESAMVEPDVTLEDMIAILHPALFPQHEMVWFRHASEPRFELLGGHCDNVNEQLVLKHDGCPASTKTQPSCQGNCGDKKKVMGQCYCDAICAAQGDCCSDIDQFCKLESPTCKNACGGKGTGSVGKKAKCMCDAECATYKDCCPDFEEECPRIVPAPTSSPPAAPSCAGNCNKPVKKTGFTTCYCDSVCEGQGDCCGDYKQQC